MVKFLPYIESMQSHNSRSYYVQSDVAAPTVSPGAGASESDFHFLRRLRHLT